MSKKPRFNIKLRLPEIVLFFLLLISSVSLGFKSGSFSNSTESTKDSSTNSTSSDSKNSNSSSSANSSGSGQSYSDTSSRRGFSFSPFFFGGSGRYFYRPFYFGSMSSILINTIVMAIIFAIIVLLIKIYFNKKHK